MRRTAEVVPVGRLGQPTALTGRLARPPAGRLAAVALVVRVAHIRMEQLTAVQALASSSSLHVGSPPRCPKHRRRAPPSPPSSDAEDDEQQDQTREEEDKQKGEEEDGEEPSLHVQSGQITTVSGRR
jgi:hypothetical protein